MLIVLVAYLLSVWLILVTFHFIECFQRVLFLAKYRWFGKTKQHNLLYPSNQWSSKGDLKWIFRH